MGEYPSPTAPYTTFVFVVASVAYQTDHQDESQLEQLLRLFDGGLRHTLVNYFRAHRMSDAEDLAHEVFLRMFRKMDRYDVDGEDLEIRDLPAYALAVARYVRHEELRRITKSRILHFSDLSPVEMGQVNLARDDESNPAPSLEQEERHRLMEACLQELSPSDRDLLINYYGARENRKAMRELVTESGSDPGALRVRVYRIRKRLEKMLRGRLKRASRGW